MFGFDSLFSDTITLAFSLFAKDYHNFITFMSSDMESYIVYYNISVRYNTIPKYIFNELGI